MAPYRNRRGSSVAGGVGVILGLILLVVLVFVLGAAFWTWVFMLVAGAMGARWHGHSPGFWTFLPLGVLMALIVGAFTSNRRSS